jgi:class 3 adenylate cyclase
MSHSFSASDSATAEIGQVIMSEKALTDALDALQRRKSPGTVIFFDLVGSTGYRHRYKAEAGLQKAHLHNMTVSKCITESGGKVVKWIGDAVMGCFDGANDALRAALAALEALKQVNKSALLRRIARTSVRGGSENDHDIHTKVAICSGLFHYFDLLAWGGPQVAGSADPLLDPMGGSVDLAARLTHLAKPDVIVMDEGTFWGQDVDGEENGARVRLNGMTLVPRDVVRWRRLLFDQVRDTVYIPHVTAFFVTKSTLTLSRLIQASDGGMTVEQLAALADEEQQADRLNAAAVVFAQKPVPCNVAGFDEPISVIALSPTPVVAPVKHAKHSWPADEVNAAVQDAERAFRKGDHANAHVLFSKALAFDRRNFHSNLRLGMLARAAGDTVRAIQYLTAAKESDPDCSLAWAVAGMVHVDDYVHGSGTSDSRESLDRAITGFTRAKKLAFAGFHGVLEQYCTGLLAITCFLYMGNEKRLKQGKGLLDELGAWTPKNLIALRLGHLATIFLRIAENNADAKGLLDVFQKNLIADAQRPPDSFGAVPYDHLLHLDDVADLASVAVQRQTVQRPRAILSMK